MNIELESGPRERLLSVGRESLSDGELVALLLGTGTRDEHVTVLAARILHESGGLDGLADADVEQFLAVPVDARNRPIGELRISVGGLSACPVKPGDVFRSLLREAAHGVVFAHNHPSGEPRPSEDDIELTRRLEAAGTLLGVRVLDHIIIGREGYFSFLDAGLLVPGRPSLTPPSPRA